MPDVERVTLQPGDPVIYHRDADTHLRAVVLLEDRGSRYLIQLTARVASGDPEDWQEPFWVDESRLSYLAYLAAWGDDEEDDASS